MNTLGKIKFEDDITERNDDLLKEDYQQRFDADFILMVEELSQLFELLAAEFDGIKQVATATISAMLP